MSAPARMPLIRAAAITDLRNASDEELTAAWHAYAGQISYHNADDSAKDWRFVPPLAARAREIEVELRSRSIDRPTGTYLMSDNDRIDWETGAWSPGWHYKKLAKVRAATS